MATAPLFADVAGAPSGGQVMWRTTDDGTRIRVGVWSGGSKGTVFIFTGRSEYIEKYGPTIARLQSGGYAAVICDWRGQGLSDRHHSDQSMGHVETFRHYQHDVAEIAGAACDMQLPKAWFILAHSMGGAIALRSLQEGLRIKKVVMTAPFFDVHMSGGLKAYASIVSALAPSFGFSGRRTPTTTPLAYIALAPFEDNFLTRDAQTYQWMKEQVARHPELVLGGPSLGWLREAFLEIRYLQTIDAELPDCLCFLGSEEHIVSPTAIHRMMDKWPNSELVVIPQARHEILMETPETLDMVWSKIFGFLQA